MTHRDDWNNYFKPNYKSIIKDLYNILEDNKDMYDKDNDKKSLLLQALYNKVSKCL